MCEKIVCMKCLPEKGLRKLISERGEFRKCSYCKNEQKCLSLEIVRNHVMDCIRDYYNEETDKSYKVDQNDYLKILCECLYSNDNSSNNELYDRCSSTLQKDLLKGFGKSKWTSKSGDLKFFEWQEFSKYVKQRKRFFFLNDDMDSKCIGNPQTLLKEKLEICQKEYCSSLEKGTSIYRCRKIDKIDNHKKFDFSFFDAPPYYRATMANRMSPPGIRYFYGASDCETALSEVYRESDDHNYFIGEFKLKKSIKLVDFRRVPDVPSMFDPCPHEREEGRRSELVFFYDFVKGITKPIPQNDRINIEYIPTQIFSEYIRTYLPEVSGILYPNNKTERFNIALFPPMGNSPNFDEILEFKGFCEIKG